MTLAVNIAQSGSKNVTFRNRIINGACVIDQRNAGASTTPNSQYTLDRWLFNNTQTGKFTVQQNAGSVTPPAGFTNYLGCTVASAYSIGSTDYFWIGQLIEGYNMADLSWGTASAKPITISFWVYSSLTGTFAGGLRNNAASRSYGFNYSIPVANTWTYITVTIVGDTTGTWLTTNGVGVRLEFSLGVGSTYTQAAGAWTAGNYDVASGGVSVVANAGATFYITGVQLEAGSTASPFEYRQYGTELALCQRYCRTYGNGLSGTAGAADRIYFTPLFEQPMRASPSISLIGSGIKVSDNYASDYTGSGSPSIIDTGISSVGGRFSPNGWTGLTAGRTYAAYGNSLPFVLFSAEL